MTVTFKYNGKTYEAVVDGSGEVVKVCNVSWTRTERRLSPVAKRGKIGEEARRAWEMTRMDEIDAW